MRGVSPLEFRKILVVGYAYDAPEGAPLLDKEGMPLNHFNAPVRMRVAFWIPQKAPFKRRQIHSFEEFCTDLIKSTASLKNLPAVMALTREQQLLSEYLQTNDIGTYLMSVADQPVGYSFVAGASKQELEALRQGAIEEQLQDFTFPRMPQGDELRTHLLPHWELRTLKALGYVPNKAPSFSEKPILRYEAVVKEG